jgi:hypothetical protein
MELAKRVLLSYYTNEGVHRFDIDAGVLWDGRSGGPFLDFWLPNQGTQDQSMMALGHDAGGYPDTISADLDNDLYTQGLRLFGESEGLCKIVHTSISVTAKDWKAYDWEDVHADWIGNKGKIHYSWDAK